MITLQCSLIIALFICFYVLLKNINNVSLEGVSVLCGMVLTVCLLYVTLFMYDLRYNEGQQDALIGKQKFILHVDKVNNFELINKNK